MQEADSGASGSEYAVGTIDSPRDPSRAADADMGTMGNLEGLSELQEPEHVSGEAKLADLSSSSPAQAAWLHVLHAACMKHGGSWRLRPLACCCHAKRQAVNTSKLRFMLPTAA